MSLGTSSNSTHEQNGPAILHVDGLARMLGKTERAIRAALRRGRLPPALDLAGRQVWRREDVHAWMAELRNWSARSPSVQVRIDPYKPDPSRFLVTYSIPSSRRARCRVRKVSPGGLDRSTAGAWAQGQLRMVKEELLQARHRMGGAPLGVPPDLQAGSSRPPSAETPPKPVTRSRPVPTLEDFWIRFSSQYVNEQKPATQLAYLSIWSRYLGPALGKLPMNAIDQVALATLRESMSRIPKASSRNQVLHKLRAILDTAVNWDVLRESQVPRIKLEKKLRAPEPPVYTEDEAARLIHAAAAEQNDGLVLVLLLLHGSLRVAEVCALRWSDVDLGRGLMTISHNFSAGVETTPKGGVAAPVGLSPALGAALRELLHVGEHVLVRRYRGEICPLTPHAVRRRLNKMHRAAQLAETGPHLLRHTGITLLARRGLDPWKLQAHARHARISTTQRYVHLAKERAAIEAAAVWE